MLCYSGLLWFKRSKNCKHFSHNVATSILESNPEAFSQLLCCQEQKIIVKIQSQHTWKPNVSVFISQREQESRRFSLIKKLNNMNSVYYMMIKEFSLRTSNFYNEIRQTASSVAQSPSLRWNRETKAVKQIKPTQFWGGPSTWSCLHITSPETIQVRERNRRNGLRQSLFKPQEGK